MTPGELYFDKPFNEAHVTLVTEVNEDNYGYIDVCFRQNDTTICRADIIDIDFGPLASTTTKLIEEKSDIDSWRDRVMAALDRNHFDTEFVQELWKELDRPVPIGYTVAQFYPEKTFENLGWNKVCLSDTICTTKQEAEELCDLWNKDYSDYPHRVIHIVVPVFKKE